MISLLKRISIAGMIIIFVIAPSIAKKEFSSEVGIIIALIEASILTYIGYTFILNDFFRRIPAQQTPSLFGMAALSMSKNFHDAYAERESEIALINRYGLPQEYVSSMKFFITACLFGSSLLTVTIISFFKI